MARYRLCEILFNCIPSDVIIKDIEIDIVKICTIT